MNSKSSPQCRFPQTYATVSLLGVDTQKACAFGEVGFGCLYGDSY